MQQPSVNITLDPGDKSRLERRLSGIRNGMPRVVSSAINDTLGPVRTAVSKAIRDEVRLKAADVRSLIRLRRANPATLEGSVSLSRQPVRLIKYGARQFGYGVKVKVRKTGAPEKIQSAFVTRVNAGAGQTEGVFVRKGKARLPIKQLMGPTAVGVLAGQPGMLDEQQDQANTRFANRLDYRADRLIDKST